MRDLKVLEGQRGWLLFLFWFVFSCQEHSKDKERGETLHNSKIRMVNLILICKVINIVTSLPWTMLIFHRQKQYSECHQAVNNHFHLGEFPLSFAKPLKYH